VARVTRLVLLSSGGATARALSHLLVEDGIRSSILTMSPPAPSRATRSLFRYVVARARSRLGAVEALRRWRQSRLPPFAAPDVFIGACNSARMVATLVATRPDFILMMGGGLLSPEVIRTARHGVLNAHPGLLPYIRGVDVIRHAVLRGVPIGVTLHYIDEGIDTGRLIRRWLVPVHDGDDWAGIAARADQLSTQAMRWAAHRVVAEGALPSQPQHERFPLCRRLPEAQAREADRRIAGGEAKRLYEQARATGDVADGGELCRLGREPGSRHVANL